MYENGDGLPEDKKMAAFWYEKAASQNNPYAFYNLGLFYETGDGLPKNPAMKVFRSLLFGAECSMQHQRRHFLQCWSGQDITFLSGTT
jgi:TPR repeat protein